MCRKYTAGTPEQVRGKKKVTSGRFLKNLRGGGEKLVYDGTCEFGLDGGSKEPVCRLHRNGKGHLKKRKVLVGIICGKRKDEIQTLKLLSMLGKGNAVHSLFTTRYPR